MSDRNDRSQSAQAAREPDASLEELRDERDPADEESVLEERLPDGPNEDYGNLASPPVETDMARTSDDNELYAKGSGLEDTPLRTEFEAIARRDDLARRMEDLVEEAHEWAEEDGSEEARDIADSLEDIYERLGVPTEDTDDEPAGLDQAEPGDLEGPGRM